MKHLKTPNKKQKIFIKSKKLNPNNWLIERNTEEEMVLIHKVSEKEKRIKKYTMKERI